MKKTILKKYLYWIIPTIIILLMGALLITILNNELTTKQKVLSAILYLTIPAFLQQWHTIIKQL